MVSSKCPNCGAPLDVEVGEVEVGCEFCGSQLRFIPSKEELEVVRTREEMKQRERVAVQKAILKKKLAHEEADKWRKTAANVAIAALPIIGESAGRAAFGVAMSRGRGCIICGCFLLALPVVLAILFVVKALAS